MKLLTSFAIVLLCASAYGQGINRAEYFLDSDPGPGNGTNIPIGSPGDNINFTTNIPVGSLPVGFHFLGVRVKQLGGPWSNFEARGFYITSSVTNTANIIAAEYFIDTDPGQGSGTAIAVTPGATTNFVFPVPTISLAAGFHFLGVRTKSPANRWSIFEARGFYVTSTVNNASNIISAEYFFDLDPGKGNATPLAVPGGATSNFTVALPTTSLGSGFHFLAIRVKSSGGTWGIFESRGFYVSSSVNNVPDVVAAEYFIDHDPGVGLGAPLTIPSGSNPTFTASIPTTGLDPGFHFLTIRTRDVGNRWSGFESRGFYIVPGFNTAGDIVAAEYYVDTDPGAGQGIPITLNTPGPIIDETLLIELSGVGSGTHRLGIRVQDANGAWSEFAEDDFTVLVCTPPAAPAAATQSRCSSGQVTLTATGADPNNEYRWYDSEFSTTPLFTGPAFTTPVLNTTTDYYVTVFDPVTLCESSKIKTTALVVPVEKPTLNATGVIQLCEGTSFVLSAPEGFASYEWSDGSLTRQVLVTENGSYSVTVSTSTCTLPVSDVVTFNFAPQPTTPLIEVTGNLQLCASGDVTLTGPAGFERYEWSNGETTRVITTSTSGAYTLTVENATGCRSSSSIPVVVSVFAPPAQPVITVTGLETICEDDFTVLSAPSGFTQYSWSNGETTQTVIVKETTTLSVQVSPGASCFSVPSEEVVITQTGTPCSVTTNPNNAPPVIAPIHKNIAIGSSVLIGLLPFISDSDGNADILASSLRIITLPASGATATITSNQELEVSYSGSRFTGTDFLVIQVCDRSGACTQGDVTIEVASEIVSFNAVSPNNDGLNEILLFEFIDIIPDAQRNTVTIYNRWGSPVFEIKDYNNDDRAFRGLDTNGNELPNGTYFYKVVFVSGRKPEDGFITLRR